MDATINANPPLPALAQPPLVQAVGLAYLVFERKQLAHQKKFLENFGLLPLSLSDETLYMRGHEDNFYCYRCHQAARNRFAGLGLEVASADDLLTLRQKFGGAIETVGWPVFHQRLCVSDPSGLIVEFVYRDRDAGRAEAPTSALPLSGARGHGAEVRLALRPSRVKRLGHVVVDVFRFQDSVRWYREVAGMLASDVLCLDSGEPVVAFLRFDCGERPTEHHSLVLSANIQVGCNHSAYQVSSLDDMAMGQQLLLKEGWQHLWGIGRHLLGSQIFDYWRDPAGEVVEHYLDSDCYTASRPTAYHRLSSEGLYQWAPNVPRSFGLPVLTVDKVKRFAQALWQGEIRLGQLLQMKRQMSEPARPWL